MREEPQHAQDAEEDEGGEGEGRRAAAMEAVVRKVRSCPGVVPAVIDGLPTTWPTHARLCSSNLLVRDEWLCTLAKGVLNHTLTTRMLRPVSLLVHVLRRTAC